jgi:hypothetical protein
MTIKPGLEAVPPFGTLTTAALTGVEVVRFGHLDACPRFLLEVGDRLAALADDGASRHARHQDLEVVRSISAWTEVGALRVAVVVVPVERPLPGVGYLWRRARIHSRIGGHFANVQASIGVERTTYGCVCVCLRVCVCVRVRCYDTAPLRALATLLAHQLRRWLSALHGSSSIVAR